MGLLSLGVLMLVLFTGLLLPTGGVSIPWIASATAFACLVFLLRRARRLRTRRRLVLAPHSLRLAHLLEKV